MRYVKLASAAVDARASRRCTPAAAASCLLLSAGGLVLLFMALLAGSPVWAQPTDLRADPGSADSQRRARLEASAALTAGNYAKAEGLLNSAFRAVPDSELLYLLGQVAQAQGRSVAALDLYRRYLELVGVRIPAEAAAAIQKYAASVSAPVATVTVSAGKGMLLWIDDHLVGVLPLPSPVWLDGGPHKFRMERAGQRFESSSLVIPAGREAELRLTPGAKETAIAVLSLTPIAMLVILPKALPDKLYHSVRKAVQEVVRSQHQAVVGEERLKALLSVRPATCLDEPDCQLAVAEQAGARSVLQVQVMDPSGQPILAADSEPSCVLQLAYVDVSVGQVAARGDTPSTACGGAALTQAVTGVFPALHTEAAGRARGMIEVNSIPLGAQVRIDGVSRGVTPLVRPALSGVHEVVLESEYYLASHTKVEVVRGQVAKVQVHMEAELLAEGSERPSNEPAPEPAPSPLVPEVKALSPFRLISVDKGPKHRGLRLALGSVAVGGSALIAGFGIAALVASGHCADSPECDLTHNTGGVGAGLLVASLALATGGFVLLGLTGPRKVVSVLVAPE